jgi:hypothetical protein
MIWGTFQACIETQRLWAHRFLLFFRRVAGLQICDFVCCFHFKAYAGLCEEGGACEPAPCFQHSQFTTWPRWNTALTGTLSNKTTATQRAKHAGPSCHLCFPIFWPFSWSAKAVFSGHHGGFWLHPWAQELSPIRVLGDADVFPGGVASGVLNHLPRLSMAVLC